MTPMRCDVAVHGVMPEPREIFPARHQEPDAMNQSPEGRETTPVREVSVKSGEPSTELVERDGIRAHSPWHGRGTP